MLDELSGSGWVMASPPFPTDSESVVARVRGEPIKSGFLTEKISDNEDEFHAVYRTGCYDVQVKVDFVSGHGQVKVEKAPGYSN
jgi:hypothetical protein